MRPAFSWISLYFVNPGGLLVRSVVNEVPSQEKNLISIIVLLSQSLTLLLYIPPWKL